MARLEWAVTFAFGTLQIEMCGTYVCSMLYVHSAYAVGVAHDLCIKILTKNHYNEFGSENCSFLDGEIIKNSIPVYGRN